MKDIQNTRDSRKIPIQKVGIKNLRYPVDVLDRENKRQHTVAVLSMFVDLPHRFKGTHMSRFVSIMNERRGQISIHSLGAILQTMTERFDSTTAHLELRFPFFIEKQAPVSGARSMMDYQCAFLAAYDRRRRNPLDLIVEVAVPVTTLCPCSRAISKKGAHSQRSCVTIRLRSKTLVWIEEIIEIAEAEASCGLYSMLKREDEKYVTELAYNNPRFAEDVARGVAQRLKQDRRVTWFQVESENQESIHNHNAYAMVSGGREPRA